MHYIEYASDWEVNNMTNANTTISVRTEKKLKDKVGKILEELGLNHSTAINIYYHQILANRGIPFDLKVPNKTTVKALEDSRTKKNMEKFNNTDELFDDLGI